MSGRCRGWGIGGFWEHYSSSYMFFTASISSSLLETIVENLCLLLTSKTREVVKAALGFMKVLLSAYPDTVLAPHLKQIVSFTLCLPGHCSDPPPPLKQFLIFTLPFLNTLFFFFFL